MNTEKVQGTNDSSIVSKLSMVNKGYFHDPFIKHFVEKSSKRSPLINRCYFARAAAISHCVESFLKECPGETQIVSLGAGFDTTYFRMQEKGLLDGTYFVEVDFPDLMRRKIALAQKGGLFSVHENDSENNPSKRIFHRNSNYIALGYDLQLVGSEFYKLLRDVGLDMDKPTFFLSEVVLTYLPSKKSSKVITWVSANFKNAIFTVFEQVTPNDSFGKVMIKHFNQIGSPLLTIHEYPTISDQVRRHQESGLETTAATTLCRFYYDCIDVETRKRVEKLELFDEFEAWHRACQHYVILCSTNSKDELLKTLVKSVLGRNSDFKMSPPQEENVVKMSRRSQKKGKNLIQRYGHCCCVKSIGGIEYAVVIGGFGVAQSNLSHQRLCNNVLLVNLQSYDIYNCKRSGDSSAMMYPMYASSVCSSKGQIYIFGGRSSPNKCTNSVTEMSLSSVCGSWTYDFRSLATSDACFPKPRWRHSASLLHSTRDTECMVIFGGRDTDILYNDWWSYCISQNHWRLIDTTFDVSQRHSSSLTAVDDRTCFLCGGLGQDEIPLGDFYKLEFMDATCISAQISRLKMPISPTKIYSHSSLFYNGRIILCGGVHFHSSSAYGDEDSRDTAYAIDLDCGRSSQISISHPSSLLLHGHSCVKSREEIVILGGGDNCFSFGTCFVESPMSLKLDFGTNQSLGDLMN